MVGFCFVLFFFRITFDQQTSGELFWFHRCQKIECKLFPILLLAKSTGQICIFSIKIKITKYSSSLQTQILLTVLMFCIYCQQLKRNVPVYLAASWRASPCVYRSFKSEPVPNVTTDGLVCAPLQTFTEEEMMLKDMGTYFLCG